MRKRAPASDSRWGGTLLALVCTAALFGPSSAAEISAIPNFAPDSRTGWIAGDPKGINPTGQDFLPPESGPGPVDNDPAHPHVDDGAARRDGKQPTYRVADLSNPILQPWVKEALRKENERALSGKPDFTPKERCWPIGVPGWLLYPVRPVYFLQTPKQVTMIWEEDHMVRHVYLDAQHSANPIPSWFGESVGHYENGDTLVIDTIGLNDRTFVDSYRTPHTTKLHVVERYRLVNGGKAIEARVRVDDVGAFTMPWTARQHYERSGNGPPAEASCAENNAAWFGYDVEPIPTAAKPDF
ncbi:MAG TPA: hypothetical protein VK479_02565 [Micropepsaceae bacterium]|nr:hypothetical protein [Micropepsaceae bacterium]